MSIADPEQYKNLEFIAGQFPPFNPWVYWTRWASSIAILAGRARAPSTTADPARLYDFCLMALSCTMASPDRLGAPLRHPAADLRRARRRGRAADRCRSRCWPRPTRSPASTSRPPCCWRPRRSTSPQSYLLFAALIVLAMLHWRPWTDAEVSWLNAKGAPLLEPELRCLKEEHARTEVRLLSLQIQKAEQDARPSRNHPSEADVPWEDPLKLRAGDLLRNRRVSTELHRCVVAFLSPAGDDNDHRAKQRNSGEFLGHRDSPSTGWIGPPGPNSHAASCAGSAGTRNQSVRDLNSLPTLSTEPRPNAPADAPQVSFPLDQPAQLQ